MNFSIFIKNSYLVRGLRPLTIMACIFSCLLNSACGNSSLLQSQNFKAIPSRVDTVIESNNAFPEIEFDTEVRIPVEPEYPILTVERKALTIDEIQGYILLLGGNGEELYTNYELSRKEWGRILEQAEKDRDHLHTLTSKLDYLREQYRNAALAPQNENIKLVNITQGKQVNLYFKGTGDGISALSVILGGNKFTYFRELNSTILGKDLCEDYAKDPKAGTDVEWLMPGNPEITYDEAYKHAEEWLKSFEIDLTLYFAEPCSIITNRVFKTTGWKFVFTRKSGELQAQFKDGAWCYINPNAPPEIGAPWSQEFGIMVIDKRGLCELWWQGASKVKQKSGTSSLLDFDSIQQNITNQLSKMYVDEQEYKHEIRVTLIELGTSMIAVKNHGDIGEYTPTWYITYENHLVNDSSEIIEMEQIMFNAIDGNYIEPRVEQEKLAKINN
ncbi:MAG: DUF6034 family protein [Christensenella sp.]|nr:DUF6034 family protein [Christensenella sp.]